MAYRCYSSEEETCCGSCARIRDESKPGCEYGDKKSWCSNIDRRDCLDSNIERDCCETCERERNHNNPSKCKCSVIQNILDGLLY